MPGQAGYRCHPPDPSGVSGSLNQGVTFNPTSRIAPRELARWLQHGELKTWLEGLASKAGSIEDDHADGYLAREIMVAGLVLTSLRDDFHPSNLLTSLAVELLVRRLVLIEKALSKDKDRGPYFKKNLAFHGIGGGATPETESAINA